MPLEMVLATCTDRNAPTRLRTAETSTAILGLSAPVAIEVAMALAVSWKPLVKSKASAVTMTTMTRSERSIRASCRIGGPQGKRRRRTAGEPNQADVGSRTSEWSERSTRSLVQQLLLMHPGPHDRLPGAGRDGPSATPPPDGRARRRRPRHRLHAGRTHRAGRRQHQPPHEGAGRRRTGGGGPRAGQRPPRTVVAQALGAGSVRRQRFRGRRRRHGHRRGRGVAQPRTPHRRDAGLDGRPRGLLAAVAERGVLLRLLATPVPRRAGRVLRGADRPDGALGPPRHPGRRPAARAVFVFGYGVPAKP